MHRIASGNGYSVENPYAKVNAAIEAENVGDAELAQAYVDGIPYMEYNGDDIVKDVIESSTGTITRSEGTGRTKYDHVVFEDLSEQEKLEIADDIRVNGGSPIEIPRNASVNPQTKKAGYQQIIYKWSNSTYTYKARWHTETPGAAKYGRGTTWVVTREIPGNAKGIMKIVEYLVGESWIHSDKWNAAITANRFGFATEEQMKILEAGHWLAK